MADPRAKQPPTCPPYRFQVVDAARYLGMGTTLLWQRTRDGLIPNHRDGHNTYWLRRDLEAYADAQAETGDAAKPTPLRAAG